jgi:hypothetical protein
LLLKVVDFRSRMLAFRRACGEPLRLNKPVRVSPVPLIPQESRTLLSNQLDNEEKENDQKQHSIRKKLLELRTIYNFFRFLYRNPNNKTSSIAHAAIAA